MQQRTYGIMDFYHADDIVNDENEQWFLDDPELLEDQLVRRMLKRQDKNIKRQNESRVSHLDEEDKNTIDQGFFLDEENPYEAYIRAYARRHSLPERLAILDAHGDNENGKWIFYEGERKQVMQSWVNSMDGKYAVLLIHSCNPGNYNLTSKKSIIVSPDRNVQGTGGACYSEDQDTLFDFFVPEIGIVDDYTLEYELNQLLGRKKEGIK